MGRKNHELAKDILQYYLDKNTFEEIPNTIFFSDLLVKNMELMLKKMLSGIEIRSKTLSFHLLSLDLPKNYIAHHFSGSWHGAWSEEKTYKNLVNTYGLMKLFSEIPDGKVNVKTLCTIIKNRNRPKF